jgi:heat shock protein HslJ
MPYLQRVSGAALALFLGACAGAGAGGSAGETGSVRDSVARGGTSAAGLIGTKWELEDLAGQDVVDEARATLEFTGDGMVSGHGSCNRFRGPVVITGDSIEFGPLVATRMFCGEAVTNQEMQYLAALNAAERWELKEPFLYISVGRQQPLRFVRE